tara:strand:+ start:91 stop:333 length:243 start_codon:yes stop_codon:yes gene_type:complete
MLTAGDLVRVMQDSFLYPADQQPWLAKRITKPQFGVVVERLSDEEATVFIDDAKWVVNHKYIQLIGDNDVYKSSKSIEKK